MSTIINVKLEFLEALDFLKESEYENNEYGLLNLKDPNIFISFKDNKIIVNDNDTGLTIDNILNDNWLIVKK